MDLTKYKARLMATSISDAYINDTVSMVNDDFDKTTSYRQIEIDGVSDECNVRLTDDSSKLKIWLRPKKSINKGMYVLLDGKMYMVTDFVPNEIYPKAEIELCNNTLRWRDTLNDLNEYSCIVKGESIELNETTYGDRRLVATSDAELKVLVQYNSDTKKIKVDDRFLFGNNAYNVIGIDNITNVYQEKGFIKLTVQATGKTATDDTTSGVANDTGNSDWGAW